jgi:putative endonuclease
MPFFIYILRSQKDGSYYVGSAKDLTGRIERHNQGRSKYTKSKRPWKIVHIEEFDTRSEAMKREYAIKRHKRKAYIENLIKNSLG